jgi:acetolactate synthase-1/2/3 large subunit
MVRFAERFDLPVATSFRRAQLFPPDHPNYAGDVGINPGPKLTERVKSADLLLLVGGRMSEMPSSSYTLIDIPNPKQSLVHVYPDATNSAASTSRRSRSKRRQQHSRPRSSGSSRGARSPGASRARGPCDYLERTETPKDQPGAFQYGQAMVWLRDRLPADAIVDERGRQLRRVGASLHAADRPAHPALADERLDGLRPAGGHHGEASLSGPRGRLLRGRRRFPDERPGIRDRGAIRDPGRHRRLDNSMYGTIRMHQERDYPGRSRRRG